MTLVQALILSLVEGITEFLPISSTGHLILTSHLLGIKPTNFITSFEIVIQIGAICAVVFLYLKMLLKNPSLIKPVVAAFLPTAIVGFIFYQIIKNIFLVNIWVTITTLFIGGMILVILEKFNIVKKFDTKHPQDISIKQAIFIGLVGSVSIIPGISRAGATIVGGMLSGLKREAAVEFSFLLAVPTIFAAGGFDLLESGSQFSANEIQLIVLGTIGSFISALVTIKVFLSFVKKNSLVVFGVYRILLSLIFIYFAIVN